MTPSYPSTELPEAPAFWQYDYDLVDEEELDDEFDTDDWYEHPEVEEEDDDFV